MEYKYNNKADYLPSIKFHEKKIKLILQNIVITATGKGFHVKLPNIFEKYKLPKVKSNAIVKRWYTDCMAFWQNQLHFAIWCSTTGCGVDYNNHLKADSLTGSLFKFHVYYQIRRILFEIKAPLPQNSSWNAYNNAYDRTAYEKICTEFNVEPNTDWRQKLSSDNGLGTIFQYWTNAGYHPLNTTYEENSMSFTDYNSAGRRHIDYIAQGKEADNAWSTFILDNSKGFSKAGVERINDSIRTYCWLILVSQSQTKTDILGTGTSFDAQKQFLSNVEDVINSPVDLPSQIQRYQNTLKFARSKVDFVYGIGLYMSPSDMELQIGTIINYNNEIMIATPDQKLGVNNEINAKPAPAKHIIPVPAKQPAPAKPAPVKQHENNKSSLIIISITLGLLFCNKFFGGSKQ